MKNEGSSAGIDITCAGFLPLVSATEDQAVIYDDLNGEWITRRYLRDRIMSVAEAISSPQKRLVFLQSSNTIGTVTGFLAAAAAGHAIALVDTSLSKVRIEQLIGTYQPDVIMFPDALQEHHYASGDWDVVMGQPLCPNMAFAKQCLDNPPIALELLLLLSTSGTTGSAKFVRLSREAVLMNAKQIAASLDIDATSVGIAHLPLHYSYGLSVVTSHLVAGGRITLFDDGVTSPVFWEKVKATGGSHFPGVPFHYTVLARLGLEIVPDSVITFTQAGGALDARFLHVVQEKIEKRNGRFFVMYGQTEASPRMTTLPYARNAEKAGSVGIALPGGRLEITAADGHEQLPVGETGNVVYTGPNVMMGYAEKRADLSLGDLLNGRLETGDLGRLDADGYLYLSGRTKRFAKLAGIRISLDEIEAEIADLGSVACLDRGDKVLIVYEGNIEEALKPRLRTLAAECKIPVASFSPRSIDVIPRKSSGKTDYARLKELVIDV